MNKNDKQSLLSVFAVILIGSGMAFLGSQESVFTGRVPVFALCVGLAFFFQWIAFIPAYLNQTEKFFDLTGSVTYISVSILAVLLNPKIDARSLLLLTFVVIWAARLGLFLFRRIRKAGEDRRFREMKKSFPRFLLTWTLQGLWVTFTLAAALAVFTSPISVNFDGFALFGSLVWLLGFGIEAAADSQKSKFRAKPQNKGKFINTGLWSWSRHPNYFGEILLWIGIAIIALPVLRGCQWLTLISPIFVTILLTRISGVPMLEKRADEKWGGQADYEQYKVNTSLLIPLPPKQKK